MPPPQIVIERREIILERQVRQPPFIVQVPGIGPPGSLDGGFSIDGQPPFVLDGSIEGTGGVLVVANGIRRFYMLRDGTIGYMVLSAGIAPGGQEVVGDLLKNGTSVWNNQIDKPRIAPGTNVSNPTVPDDVNFIANDYFTVNIIQVGTSPPGGAAAFGVWYF